MEKVKAFFAKYIQILKQNINELREDKNALIFMVFLFLSTCFWILLALSKDDYNTELDYPVRFTNNNQNELIKVDLRRDLTLKVKGGGFSILKYQLNDQFLTESIDLTDLPRITMNETQGVVLSTSQYMTRIEGRLANGLSLLDISPDTLFIPLEEKISKKVPVRLMANISFEQQCQLAGDISLNPDSVLISGSQNIIDTLQFIDSKQLDFEDLKDTIVRNVALKEYDWVEISPKRVVLNIPVEPFTETSVLVPVQSLNLPDSLDLKSFPSQIKVSYRVGLSNKLFGSQDFKVVIDFNDYNLNKLPTRLKLKMLKTPDGISNLDYSPVFIEYLLEKSCK
ncbi:CdaR family protein [Carboxylicivirga sp. N1Y90]|uniref:CdaR family protein n=1 Tax=Carboxylicivirga fragile TaxID=3417571 RepID=UPI003D331D10|nr:YbbR-like domain-containing protein [Marinilabiliaceae bacterium N1Y90]